MSNESVGFEYFEEDKPSYFSSYFMSLFVLFGVISLAAHQVPLWPISLAHVVMLVWFGVLFYWICQNAPRQRSQFLSDRFSVKDGIYRHTFRYAVTESTFVEIPASEITEVIISEKEPRYIAVTGGEGDLYFVPGSADLHAFGEALKVANPAIRITTQS
jgi:hypothetical protein